MAFLSTISYNLYIWHQYLAREMAYKWHLPPAATPDPHLDPAWQLMFTLNAFAVAIAFSAAITYAFERPLLREGPRALLAPVRWARARLARRPATPASAPVPAPEADAA
jgi:peptidoglycan/LPS O-acetylase OafA/YrhL